MKIEHKFELENLEIEEGYPDQAAEYKYHLLVNRLLEFIHRVTDLETASIEEHEAMRFEIAVKMLGSFGLRYDFDLMKKRLESRPK